LPWKFPSHSPWRMFTGTENCWMRERLYSRRKKKPGVAASMIVSVFIDFYTGSAAILLHIAWRRQC
jgi:hypothetical protein